MFKCYDCKDEMEIDPSDYDIDDIFYCENCGAAHLVTGVAHEDDGIVFKLLEEDK